jgi:hypothetical protein
MNLDDEIDNKRAYGLLVCQRLTEEIDKLGFESNVDLAYPVFDKASFVLTKDPYTGKGNLTGFWYEAHNKQRIGRIQFNSDDSFYAEFNVIKPHPKKPQWFVDMVTAWGNHHEIKAEASLLPAL